MLGLSSVRSNDALQKISGRRSDHGPGSGLEGCSAIRARRLWRWGGPSAGSCRGGRAAQQWRCAKLSQPDETCAVEAGSHALLSFGPLVPFVFGPLCNPPLDLIFRLGRRHARPMHYFALVMVAAPPRNADLTRSLWSTFRARGLRRLARTVDAGKTAAWVGQVDRCQPPIQLPIPCRTCRRLSSLRTWRAASTDWCRAPTTGATRRRKPSSWRPLTNPRHVHHVHMHGCESAPVVGARLYLRPCSCPWHVTMLCHDALCSTFRFRL